MSVCAVPGAPPRTSTPATVPFSHKIMVQPVGRRVSVKWPTLMPSISVSPPQRSDGTRRILSLRRGLYLQILGLFAFPRTFARGGRNFSLWDRQEFSASELFFGSY